MDNIPLYLNKDDILAKARTANGHFVGEYNVNRRDLTNNKGIIGQIIEEGVFGYRLNNRAEPDFLKAGVELKVTGVKKLKNNSFVAKERLVLNLIDFFKEADCDFENSSFWKKNKNLLLMFYLYIDDVSPDKFPIIESIMYSYPLEDLKIIKDDWEYINKRINDGEAHLISEADTMYLAACIKGINGEVMRLQPFSKTKAKQRAFCLKNSYLNHIINNYFIGDKCEKILSISELREYTFVSAINSSINSFIGKSETELQEHFNIPKCKNSFELITAKILGINGKINKSDEFLKANIIAKTIRIEENDRIIESMSFPNFEFTKIIDEDWNDSELRNMFFETKFMFVLFRKRNNKYVFDGVKFWNMPVEILDSKVFDVWSVTKNVVEKGNIISGVQYLKNGSVRMKTNFPGMAFNGVCHVRPHAKNSDDSFDLPIHDNLTGITKYTKQCFWLNNTFIRKIVNE